MEKNQKSGDKTRLIVEEFLAKERTLLAKERTRQSFIRTGIALVGMGVLVLKLFEQDNGPDLWVIVLSTLLVLLGLIMIIRNMLWGREYEKRKRSLEREIHKLEPEGDMITDYDILSNHKGRLIP